MGYKIREAREEARLTQEELAARSGVSRATIVAIESGKAKNVLVSTLCKIATALGRPLSEIFFDESA